MVAHTKGPRDSTSMTTWKVNPGGCSHDLATAKSNIELPNDSYSDYHYVAEISRTLHIIIVGTTKYFY